MKSQISLDIKPAPALNTPMASFRYFEDFRQGEHISLGEKIVTRDEIIAFAQEFDPQPFHLDEEAGAASMLGALSASGWHTAAVLMRLLCDNLLLQSSCMGAPGVDHLKWMRPVHAGDRLSASMEVLETRALRSRPELGVIKVRLQLVNQDGLQVLDQENSILFGRKAVAV